MEERKYFDSFYTFTLEDNLNKILATSINLIENIFQKKLINAMLCVYNDITYKSISIEALITNFFTKQFGTKCIMLINWKVNDNSDISKTIQSKF